jgi:hypothetical protein
MSKTLGERLADLNIEVGTAITIDWQQARIQAAINITCQLSEHWLGAGYSENQIARQAVALADALVMELQKKGVQDE